MPASIEALAQASRSATARLRKVAPPSPLIESVSLSRHFGCKVLLKCEHLLPTGSFKFRGGFNKVALLSKAQKARGVVTASSGNHGLALAVAAKAAGVKVTVHAPVMASRAKLDAIVAQGAELVLHEGDCLVAEIAARAKKATKKAQRNHARRRPLERRGLE